MKSYIVWFNQVCSKSVNRHAVSCSVDFKPAVQVTYGCIILLYGPIQDGKVEHFYTVHQ